MNGVSFSATTENKKGILLDPRTKLVLLLTITTLMFSTSNEGIMNIVKPCLSLVPFMLILSERHFKTAGKYLLLYVACNGVQREHNKKLNNGLPILHKVPPKRDYGRYFCIMAEKGGTSHGGLTEKLSLFFHAKKQEVNAYGR